MGEGLWGFRVWGLGFSGVAGLLNLIIIIRRTLITQGRFLHTIRQSTLLKQGMGASSAPLPFARRHCGSSTEMCLKLGFRCNHRFKGIFAEAKNHETVVEFRRVGGFRYGETTISKRLMFKTFGPLQKASAVSSWNTNVIMVWAWMLW